MTEKQMVMKKINESSFAMDDAVLYLDTHPWHWIHEPWPWEVGGNC